MTRARVNTASIKQEQQQQAAEQYLVDDNNRGANLRKKPRQISMGIHEVLCTIVCTTSRGFARHTSAIKILKFGTEILNLDVGRRNKSLTKIIFDEVWICFFFFHFF